MLDKKMDEYVTRVENDAYELGMSAGKHKERERILDIIDEARSVLLTDGKGLGVDDERVLMLTNLMMIINKGE